ncbi:hypothetical protein EG329_010436 [Mollisiaceae sp. DMI_Dod_QoI]|nr:hypothetical protein EG329_010436 [Helotiales sp. DMI_Dod_QoI]
MVLNVIVLGETKYIAGTAIVGSISRSPPFRCEESPTQIPVTVINAVGRGLVSPQWIQDTVSELRLRDDVISAVFAERVIVEVSEDESGVLLEQISSPAKFFFDRGGDISCDGPYILEGRDLYKAYKLYGDTYNAFVCGVIQSEDQPLSFKQIESKKYIPVPSRCYFPAPSEQNPLSGKRIAVKDIYDLRGIPTGAGCRGYAAHHGNAKDTAECIKILLNLGAVIVGKAKTVQFASGMASADWCADVCPTNPRGDGQLDTDCSSSGSAAALAGYEWLDFAIGSDSLGSMTGPAAACGLFGLRPSFGALSNIGAVPVSAVLDTPGHFSRSVNELSLLTRSWLKSLDTNSRSASVSLHKKPITILVPQESQLSHAPPKISAMKEFVRDLEAYCGVAHTSISIDALWHGDPKRPPRASSLKEYLYRTVADIQLHDCWKSASRFLETYSEEKSGNLEIDPLIKYKWELGRLVTDRDYELALERKEIFKGFLERTTLREGTIIVLPGGDPDIRFRHQKTPDHEYDMWQGFGFQNTTCSVLGGLPAVNVPVSQRLYRSKLDGEMVNQPMSIMVLGPRGSDIWLIQHLEEALPEHKRNVRVGSDTF